jgi:ELWxxDGT repeat protein
MAPSRSFFLVVLLGAWLAPAGSLLAQIPLAQTTPSPRFRDSQNYWAAACLETIGAEGIIQGYPDGSFGPNGTITRAEFAAVMIKAVPNAAVIRSAPNFTDVPANYWAKGAIAKAYSLGFLSGYPGNVFRPNQPISKAQALTILANSQSFQAAANPEAVLQPVYNDAAEIPAYARGPIASATGANLVVNYPNVRQLQPNRNLSRGEAAALLCQVNALRAGRVSPVPEQYVVRRASGVSATLLKEFPYQSSNPLGPFEITANQVFFSDDSRVGHELWVTDGTAPGTRLVRDLTPEVSLDRYPSVDSPQFIASSGSQVWFSTLNAAWPNSLWRSDGTSVGTVAIASTNPALSSALSNAKSVDVPANASGNGGVFPFVITTQDDDYELWQAGGLDESATRLLKRFERPPVGFAIQPPSLFTPLLMPNHEQFFFIAPNSEGVSELWGSDGTPAGTILLNTPFFPSLAAFTPSGRAFTPWKNRVYMAAGNTFDRGAEWWTSDGTPAGTLLLKDIYPDSVDSVVQMLTGIGDRFFALSDSPNGFELWVSEGTAATTRLVKRLSDKQFSYPQAHSFVAHNNKLFFSTPNAATYGQPDALFELWVTDGTEQKTQRLGQFPTYPVTELTVFRDLLFFNGNGPNGRELWVSDGTAAGTKQLIDLSPGTTKVRTDCERISETDFDCSNASFYDQPNSSELSSLTVQGDWLYFILNNRDLYRTDGTVAGTQKLQTMGNISAGNPARILKWNQKLLITGYDAARDRVQLWSIP